MPEYDVYDKDYINTDELPPEVQQYEKDVLSGKIKVDKSDERTKKWIDGLKDVKRAERTAQRNEFLKSIGEFFVSLTKPVDVTAKATTPTQTPSPNYIKYILIGGAVLAAIMLFKK